MIPIYPVPCGEEECTDPLEQTAQQSATLVQVISFILDDLADRLKIQSETLDAITKKAASYLKLRLTNQYKKLESVTDVLSTTLENKLTEQQVLLNYVVPGVMDASESASAKPPAGTTDVEGGAKPLDGGATTVVKDDNGPLGTGLLAQPAGTDSADAEGVGGSGEGKEETILLTPFIEVPGQQPGKFGEPPAYTLPPKPGGSENGAGAVDVPLVPAGTGANGGNGSAVVPVPSGLVPVSGAEQCQPSGQWVTVCIQAQLLRPVPAEELKFPDQPVFSAVDDEWPGLEGDDDEGWYGE